MPSHFEITQILKEINAGQKTAWSELIQQAYPELLRISRHMRGMKQHMISPTLDTHALISEAFGSLYHSGQLKWKNKKHFYLTFAQACRFAISVFHREKHCQKRGGDLERLPIEAAAGVLMPEDPDELMSLDQAMDQLAQLHERAWEGVILRIYTGLSETEIADLQEISVRTVARDWVTARAFLSHYLSTS